MSSITGLGLRNRVKSKIDSSKGGSGGLGSSRVAGWVGRGKDKDEYSPSEHVSTPIASLKDPSSFGPPPKRTTYHGSPLSPSTTSSRETASSMQLSRIETEEEKPRSPPVPYRADTTGLSTSHLPPPPGRRDGANGQPPSLGSMPKPSLPPRLPPRRDTNPGDRPVNSPSYQASAEPAAHRGIMNQESLGRLGAAGVSVPGFGIGAKSPDNEISTQSSTHNNAQLNELQSRFSRLNTTSSADPPKQGTTWAEKQAAFKTASSFRNDPSSVSLSDARSAASTANNFRERHGEQVASGLKTANSLNSKYGVSDKLASYGASSPTSGYPQNEQEEENHAIVMQDNTIAQKKRPPAPPKKKPGLSANPDSGGRPPPIPLASKPKPPISSLTPRLLARPQSRDTSRPQAPQQLHSTRIDVDLDLQSLWFAKSPPEWPPESVRKGPESRGYTYSSGWSSNGIRKTYNFLGLITYSTLACTKIKLSWDASNPAVTVKAEQRHVPPPAPLASAELEESRVRYSEPLVTWCESKIGTQVGDGECWTLASDGLKAVGAQCIASNIEPCMESQSYIHGSVLYEHIYPHASTPSDVRKAGVARGDIMQFYKSVFRRRDGMGVSSAGNPDHTAVVMEVEKGGVLRVLEQNMGGRKIVGYGRYDLVELSGGELRVYRPVARGYVKHLEMVWP